MKLSIIVFAITITQITQSIYHHPHARPIRHHIGHYGLRQHSCKVKKIDTGSFSTPYQWNSNHPMVRGHGKRKVTKHVRFTEKFSCAPKVVASLSEVDTNKTKNLRIICKVSHVTKHGFVLDIQTWHDTSIYCAKCSWIAQGY